MATRGAFLTRLAQRVIDRRPDAAARPEARMSVVDTAACILPGFPSAQAMAVRAETEGPVLVGSAAMWLGTAARVLTAECAVPRGGPGKPFSRADVLEKMKVCGGDAAMAAQLLDAPDDMTLTALDLIRLMRGPLINGD